MAYRIINENYYMLFPVLEGGGGGGGGADRSGRQAVDGLSVVFRMGGMLKPSTTRIPERVF